jgi:cell division transport system ATP-binding protein
MIELQDVRKAYRGLGVEAVSGVTCSIARGEFVALLGPSGAGKSTLLKLIASIERPSAGRILVGGQDITRIKGSALPYLRRTFGLTFQDQKLLLDRTVLDNVMLPLVFTGSSWKDARARARASLEKVGMREKEAFRPAMLSGGEQQRVAIARAIVNRPAILLADEPSSNLDAGTAQRVVEIFREFHRVGVTVLVATHDPHLFSEVATRSLTIEGGKLLDAPSASQVGVAA